jgi:hypothetical protein
MELGKTSSGADGVLHHPPAAFKGVEVVPTRGGEALEAQRALIMVEGRVERVRPMDPAAIDNHPDLLARCAEGRQHVREIVAHCLGIKVRHDCREDFRRPLVDRTHDVEQDPAGDPTPRAILQPRVPCEPLVACDLPRTQRSCAQARALGCAPLARPRPGKTPADGCIVIEQHALALAGLGLQGGTCESSTRQSSRRGSKAPWRAPGASAFVLHAQRTRSRPSWTPVSRAKTVASSRQLHGEYMEPCSRGS